LTEHFSAEVLLDKTLLPPAIHSVRVRQFPLLVAMSRGTPLLPGKAGDPGRTGSDNRLFVNGCLWVLRSGAHWRDLPERYGKGKTVHRRFSRWCHAGVWEQEFEALTADSPPLTGTTNI
jgi:hypothetical protein